MMILVVQNPRDNSIDIFHKRNNFIRLGVILKNGNGKHIFKQALPKKYIYYLHFRFGV